MDLILKDQINKKWYTQAFNCTPLLLIPCAKSGFDILPSLGDKFQTFLFEFKEDYGKMYYSVDCLERMSKVLINKLKNNPLLLQEVRKEWLITFENKIQNIKTKELSKKTNSEVITLLKESSQVLRLSVGQSHIIEPFSLTSDNLIKEKLRDYIPDEKELNETFAFLSSPTEKSFLNSREEDLYHISQITDSSKRIEKINHHLKKFYWVQNSYSGRIHQTAKDIEEELATVKRIEPTDFNKIKNKKERILQELKLDQELKLLLEIVEEATNWQDIRKKKILIAIDITERILEELSRRIRIQMSLLRYLVFEEINEDIFNKQNLRQILEERKEGMIVSITNKDKTIVSTGIDYEQFHKEMGHKDIMDETRVLVGTTASLGTVIGPVKICKSLQDIKDVKEGDILVASMTRPEFLSAMKKAAAFVTDEGG